MGRCYPGMDFIQPCQDVLAVDSEEPLAAWHNCRCWGLLEGDRQHPRSTEEIHTLSGVAGQTLEPLFTVVALGTDEDFCNHVVHPVDVQNLPCPFVQTSPVS